MNKKIAKVILFANKIDRRHLQIAGFFLMLAITLIAQSPADGGGGPV